MTRGQLPKAYLRIDPDLDAKHPDQLAEFIRLLCAANRQPRRGRFKSRAIIEALLGKRAVKALIERGDVNADDGEWVVHGWDRWQEGNLDVAARMRVIREGRTRTNGAQTAHNKLTDGSHNVAPTPEASGSKALGDDEPPNPQPNLPDEIELLTDDVLAPGKASPKQLRAMAGFGRVVGRQRVIDVLLQWRGQLDVEDRFTGAFGQLMAEADAAKAARKPNEFAYMDAES